jgi:hypothetical protein
MDSIVIEGVKPWDGHYPLDIREAESTFTTREWGWIKRLAGYLPANVWDGFEGADAELIAALAVIALHRAGKIEARQVPDTFERFLDVEYDLKKIRIEIGDPVEQGDDVVPLPSSNRNGSSSGAASTPSSETSAEIPVSSGTPASATSESDQPTQVT